MDEDEEQKEGKKKRKAPNVVIAFKRITRVVWLVIFLDAFDGPTPPKLLRVSSVPQAYGVEHA